MLFTMSASRSRRLHLHCCRIMCAVGARLSALHPQLQLQAAHEQLSADGQCALVVSTTALLATCTAILNHTGGTLASPDNYYSALQLVLRADVVSLRLGAANLQRTDFKVLTEPVALLHDLVLLAVRTDCMPNLINGMPAPLFVEWLADITRQLDLLRVTQGVLAARSACNCSAPLSDKGVLCWHLLLADRKADINQLHQPYVSLVCRAACPASACRPGHLPVTAAALPVL